MIDLLSSNLDSTYKRNIARYKIKQLSDTEKDKLCLYLYSNGTPVQRLYSIFELSRDQFVDWLEYHDIKRCSECNLLKSRDKFNSHQGFDGLCSYCKECEKKYQTSNVAIQNRKKRNQTEKNKSKNREYQHKRKQIPINRLNDNFVSLISRSLKKYSKLNKDDIHWEDLVGYSLQDLKEHLESKFQEGMTWENYGQWHIDHIKPRSLFNIQQLGDEEFMKCWSLNNLQPLWAKDNLKKSNFY